MSSSSTIHRAVFETERIDTHGHLLDQFMSLRELAERCQTGETTAALIDARVAAEGCRQLYGIDPGAFVRADAPRELFDKAESLRAAGGWPAIQTALDRARVRTQLVFCDFKEETRPFVDTAPPGRVAYLAFVDSALSGDGRYPSPDFLREQPEFVCYDALCELLGPLADLDDYLDALNAGIDRWRSLNVVGMKTAMAYTTGLAVEDPTRDEARTAFARKRDMTMREFRVVHAFAFREALAACGRNGLPVVIHTGFQIWGHASLAQANPLLLHDLLIDPRYRGLTFVLLHGGNPYVGETAYLAGMFPNFVLDFTWIPWMNPARFRFALTEWLAQVPHTRMCFGSDAGMPEVVVGADAITRSLIAGVLHCAVDERLIDERYALEFVEHTYLATPRRVFGLA